MDIRKLQRVIVDGLEDVKAQDILVFNTEHLSPLFERVIVASGTSNRQTKSLAASVREAVKSAGAPIPRTEGEENGEWIVVDCGAAVVHVMQPAIREYYHLEELWGEKPVRMKIGGGEPTRLVKASPAMSARETSKAAKAAAGRKPVAGTASRDTKPRRPAASKRPGPPSRGASSRDAAPEGRQVPAKRSPPTSPASTRAAPAKSRSAKPASAKSAATKRAPAKRASPDRRAVPAKVRNSGR